MHDDRVIIESVLAQNRDAIIDLHNLDSGTHVQCQRSPSKINKGGGRRAHTRSHSSSVEFPPISDVPPLTPTSSPTKGAFSKRGVRLGVHMSILDMGAHNASDRLKDKWIQTSRSYNLHPRRKSSRAALGTLGHLAKISEADSMTSVRGPLEDMTNLTISAPKVQEVSIKEASMPPAQSGGHRKSLSHGFMTSPVGKGLHKIMEVTGKLVQGNRRSLTQQELEAEIENYGSVGA